MSLGIIPRQFEIKSVHDVVQTDSWLQTKGLDPYYSLFDSRCNVLISGAHIACHNPSAVFWQPCTLAVHLIFVLETLLHCTCITSYKDAISLHAELSLPCAAPSWVLDGKPNLS